MKAIIIAALVLALAGCASFTKPENELRVTEYGGNGSYMAQASGQIAGCRAIQGGDVKGCMRFKGTTCSFVSEGCK